MADQQLLTPPDTSKIKRWYASGTDRQVYVDVPVDMPAEQVKNLLRAKADLAGGRPSIGAAPSTTERVLTGLLPDAVSALATRIPGVKQAPGLVKLIASVLGAGAGEGMRASITGDELDPMTIATAGIMPPAMGKAGKVVGSTGERLQQQAFRSTPRHEGRFKDVDIVGEIKKRKYLPNKASVAANKAEQKTLVTERQQAVQGQHAPTYDVIDSLLDLRTRMEPSATWGRADTSEIDDLINHIQNMPHSGGPFHGTPGGGMSRSRPANEMLDVKVFRGMAGDPAFNARQGGKLAGGSPEIDAAMSQGLATALDPIPGVSAASRGLQVNKAMRAPLTASEHRQRTHPLIDHRYLAGGLVSLLSAPWTGGAGAAGAVASLPLGALAASPLAQAKWGRRASALGELPIEDAIRALLAAGGAVLDSEGSK